MSVTAAAENIAIRPRRADPYKDRSSLEFRFRSRRFARIQAMIETVLAEKVRCDILDLGGTETYWAIGADFLDAHRGRIHITLVNPEAVAAIDGNRFESLYGDATDPRLLEGRQFDLVHSNSVIEHVGDHAAMDRFAQNARRLGMRYYIQTPNYWFPYEPHFRLPGFQYLPSTARSLILRKFAVGFFQKVADAEEARAIIAHHRLVSARQMRRFFPDAAIGYEKALGLNKSILAIRDLPAESARLPIVDAPSLAPSIDDLATARERNAA